MWNSLVKKRTRCGYHVDFGAAALEPIHDSFEFFGDHVVLQLKQENQNIPVNFKDAMWNSLVKKRTRCGYHVDFDGFGGLFLRTFVKTHCYRNNRYYGQFHKPEDQLEELKHVKNFACSVNGLFIRPRRIPLKEPECTELQRNPEENDHTSIELMSAENQMDRLKSWSNLNEVDPEIILMQAPPLDLSSLKASNSSLQDTPQTSQGAEGRAQKDHSSAPQRTAPDKLPVPQKIACQSFGNISSSNSNDRVFTDNHNTSENRHLSSLSDQRKGIGPVLDVSIFSEENQFQWLFRQLPIARPVFVSDTLHTIDFDTNSGHASQPDPRSDRPLPQPFEIDELPSVNLTNWFTSQQPVTSEGTATQPQPIPTRVSMDQTQLGSSWNDVQKSFELFSSGKDESIFEKKMIKQPFLFWRNTSKTSELNDALARAA